MAAIVVSGLIIGIAAAVVVPIYLSTKSGIPVLWLPIAIVSIVVVAILVFFTRLSVRVDGREVRWEFGYGFPRYALPLSEVDSARIVTNPMLYGFGIRMIPGGMLYNVSGSAAVELVRRDQTRIRIGTDDPQALLAAIESSRGAAR
jgi:hypothetical protein